MAEKQEVEQEHDPEEGAPGYKPPAEKSVNDILAADAEDESLRKYKESLGLTGSFIVCECCFTYPTHRGINVVNVDISGVKKVL